MNYNFSLKRFEETDKTPGKIAIAGSDTDINWSVLKLKTEQLTDIFRQLNIPQGHPIIIYGHKEYFFALSVLSCIHAGLTFIPIDKIYPAERIKNIIQQTGAQMLINCGNEPAPVEMPVIINNQLQVIMAATPDYSGKTYPIENDILQYIMFTSGSTGEPKGVQIAYSSVLAFIKWTLQDLKFTADDVFMNQAPFTFDVSLFDLLNAFALGATLVLNASEIAQNQNAFIERIKHYQCTVWSSTPSFAFLFLRHPEFNDSEINCLNKFIFIGEELPVRTAAALKKQFKNAKVYNAYGPTEATIITTLIEITNDIIQHHTSLPIGFAMPESELFIKKTHATDKEGELVIAGDHVSLGYFKNETLNQQKFFVHKGKRAFNTGDVAYYENEMWFFSGRNDEQIKMNGYRIELNEINNQLRKHPWISDAVSVPLKKNNEVKKIISFVIVQSTTVKSNEINTALLAHLSESLPYYMLPSDIVVVDKFPFNASHKIDKNKLANDYIISQTR